MSKIFKTLTPLLPLLALAGCIDNDIPFPRIQQNIVTLAAEGEISGAQIDTRELTAVVTLGEDVDIRHVKFTEYTITEGGESSLNLLEGSYDLSSPLTLTLTRFQSYEWTLSAQQEIERYCTFAGQIGETAVDLPGHRVVLYVPRNLDRSHLTLTSIKLGPEGHTSMVPDLQAGQIIDASEPVKVQVTSWGRTESWTIYVDVTDAVVTTTRADGWVNVIWAYGEAPEDAANGFEYRLKGATEWMPVDDSYVTHNGGAFSCYIPHLKALSEYEVRAVSGENKGNEIVVSTGAAEQLPDASFDNWWLNGKVWCPWSEGGTPWWDTGNTGAATLGQSNVTPSDNTPSGSGKSACLETRFVGIGAIGKLAAGSLFSGSFKKVDGTNGILDFGRPWTARPTRLHGYYSYTSAPINYASQEYRDLIGRPDSCHIWVALIDLDTPFQIRTNPNNRQLFNKKAPYVIAYGEYVHGTSTSGWETFDIRLNYNSTSRVPKYLLVVTAASKYGDYFTGGTGSVLYIDDFRLDYDY